MCELTSDDFTPFFFALWKQTPFPWQVRLARWVCDGEGWPLAVDLPTATGKTAVIDIAVFRLALQAAMGEARTAPLRVVYVVDRRLVVDSAWERAQRIRDKLAIALTNAENPVLTDVARRLSDLAGEGRPPLEVARLRGGTPRETDWAATPVQPLVLCSTVDQAGSRLLFRGYGVSDSMKPVHAGLLGSDALWLLDEAHLSQPFVQTLRAIERLRRPPWVEREPLASLGVVELSATRGGAEPAFTLDAADEADVELRRRLRAHKVARLVEVERSATDRQKMASDFANEAERLAANVGTSEQPPVVGVVVNRVRLARDIYQVLRRRADEGFDDMVPTDVQLMIGPVRPLDRDEILGSLLPRIRAQDRRNFQRLFVVATQTVEVGADLDFDALLTQIAPLDSLRQRFGRLDRLGRHTSSAAVVAAPKEEVTKGHTDPVYASASGDTWKWLKSVASVDTASGQPHRSREPILDFGNAYLRDALVGVDLAPLTTPRVDAPILLPSFVDLWSRTSPVPAADPEVSLFLHGPEAGPADVTFVWRCDIEKEDDAQERVTQIVEALPPSTLEGVQVSLFEAQRWMAGVALADSADLESSDAMGDTSAGGPGRWVWRWDGQTCKRITSGGSIRPGDVLVVPATLGGCDQFGWSPTDTRLVPDIAERAALVHHHRLVLRLCREALMDELRREEREADGDGLWARVRDVLNTHAEEGAGRLVDALQDVTDLPRRWTASLVVLAGGRRPQMVTPYGDDPADGRVLVMPGQLDAPTVQRLVEAGRRSAAETGVMSDARDISEPQIDTAGLEAVTEGVEGDYAAGRVELDRHLDGVERFARRFALAAGLSEGIVQTVVLAARLHDTGKSEPRFQALLRGGDVWSSSAKPLAKSGTRLSPYARQAILQKVGLPSSIRHECWSVRLAERYLASMIERGDPCADPDLALWLIGTHHGWGRPFFPAVMDQGSVGELRVDVNGFAVSAPVDHGLIRLDSDWSDRFERLVRRYGAWELARLEAILRLADHRQSGQEGSEGSREG